MPDSPDPKFRDLFSSGVKPASGRRTPYAELAATSNYTFLTGASHPEELVAEAASKGLHALAVTDTNTLGGVVRAHVEARSIGMPLIIGCRLVFTDPHAHGASVLVYPTDRAAYGRLCRLLTLGKRAAEKGECKLTIDDLIAHESGLLAVVEARDLTPGASSLLVRLRSVFNDDRLSVAAFRSFGPDDDRRMREVGRFAKDHRVPLVATNRVLYHDASQKPMQDVLTCIRHGCTLAEAGLRLQANSERYIKDGDEMSRLFRGYESGISRTIDIADRALGFSLDQLRYEYADEVVPAGMTPITYLAELTWEGATRYYGEIPGAVRAQIEKELKLIDELSYAPYFLTVHDIVAFARSRGILCQGRGAAANSAVCFCLGVTSVDPNEGNLLFERFISKERNEPPDIDIDFEHERREEVIQYIYGKYGRERAALTAEIISYRGKSAVRDVGKALGLSLDAVDKLAKDMEWWSQGELNAERLRGFGLDPRNPTMRQLAALCGRIMGFPRHRSQHVGGFVITRGPLCESVPIENAAMPDRTVVEWDKDDLDAMGMLKVDILGLGMLSCIRRGFEMLDRYHGRTIALETVPRGDAEVYDMACRADTVGVFQIESRAQMSMLPRLRPREFYDLVIQVAIVRPGPIQGKMVHPYLKRRAGLEKYDFPNDDIKRVLGKTHGVPLFQEQAMSLVVVAAGFTPGEADQLRRAMAAWKRKGDLIEKFGRKMVSGMLSNGYTKDFADRCVEQIKGFSSYGFPESHAASFARLVYVSAWLKCHYPAAFAASLINSQPMGFYAPAQIIRDAKDHKVEILPVDVNQSRWDCTLEGPAEWPALRLGMRLVSGLGEAAANAITQAVGEHGPVASVERLWRLSGTRVADLRRLASADAFNSMGLDRQRALWAIRRLRDEHLPLFDGTELEEPVPTLPAISTVTSIRHDYSTIGLSLKGHPIAPHRGALASRKALPAAALLEAKRTPHGRRIAVAGLVICRQRPSTASGIVFITLEDETGVANLIVRPNVYTRYRKAAKHSLAILVHGTIERAGEVVHVMVRRIQNLADITGFDGIQASTSRDFR
ncbi:MAG: error-prone DNA polymerase [Tepidisphaera sp.]